jgi:hypothetical protein
MTAATETMINGKRPPPQPRQRWPGTWCFHESSDRWRPSLMAQVWAMRGLPNNRPVEEHHPLPGDQPPIMDETPGLSFSFI